MTERLKIDLGMKDAMELWYEHALPPGSCCELLLRGRYKEAYYHAHMHIRPIFDNHIKLAESFPIECRNENYDKWRGPEFHKCRYYFDETLFTDKGENE